MDANSFKKNIIDLVCSSSCPVSRFTDFSFILAVYGLRGFLAAIPCVATGENCHIQVYVYTHSLCRFKWVMLVVANGAWSCFHTEACWAHVLLTAHLQILLLSNFQTCHLLVLAQVTSHETTYQILHSSPWRHKRLATTFFSSTYAVVILIVPNAWKQTLMCGIGQVFL